MPERGIIVEVLVEVGIVSNRAREDLPHDPIVLIDQPARRA